MQGPRGEGKRGEGGKMRILVQEASFYLRTAIVTCCVLGDNEDGEGAGYMASG